MHTEKGTRNCILLPVLRTFHVVLIWFVEQKIEMKMQLLTKMAFAELKGVNFIFLMKFIANSFHGVFGLETTVAAFN